MVRNLSFAWLAIALAPLAIANPVSTKNALVRGGQFKDLILPMPIIEGLESEGIWGNSNVLPRDRDNGIEDNQWCYWGGNPVLGKDGRYHIAICRWPEANGHHGWFHSEVAHCVSESPLGPYQVTQTIVEQGHNPEVLAMPDGTYRLHVLNNNSVYSSQQMPGPWKRIGSMRMESRGLRTSNRLGSNLTTTFRPDGSILLMQKNGDVSISKDGILGSFQLVSIENYSRATGYPEDPVIWRSRHLYHAIYNHAQDRRSAYMRSLDGIHWKNEEGIPYDSSTTFYIDGTKNTWHKFERPKVLQDKLGRATHLALAVMDVAKGADKPRDNHSSKNLILPLITEKIISIIGDQPIGSETESIDLLIKAEEGFNPSADLKIDSLRFGSDSIVNYGDGCRAINVQKVGKDLVVTFAGTTGQRSTDFDFKLLGETKTGDLVFGYALLPGHAPTGASLIALPAKVTPVDGKQILESIVENWGLEASEPGHLEIHRISRESGRMVKTITLPSIQSYGSHHVSVELPVSDLSASQYNLVFSKPLRKTARWETIDDTSERVVFAGSWKLREGEAQCHLGTEHVSTTLGDSVTFRFTGCRAFARGKVGRQMGSFDVFIDGNFIEKVRCNWGAVVNAPVYQTGLLKSGEHTLTLVKAESEFNGEVTIDSFGSR